MILWQLDRLTCATTQHVSANEQIYIHYGDRSNHQIFLFMVRVRVDDLAFIFYVVYALLIVYIFILNCHFQGFLCVDNITNDPSLINSFLDPRDQASLKLTLRDNQRFILFRLHYSFTLPLFRLP